MNYSYNSVRVSRYLDKFTTLVKVALSSTTTGPLDHERKEAILERTQNAVHRPFARAILGSLKVTK